MNALLQNLKFNGDFRKECTDDPSPIEWRGPDKGWLVIDPQRALAVLETYPSEEVEVDVCRDGGTIVARTCYEEFCFPFAKAGPIQRNYALRRYTKKFFEDYADNKVGFIKISEKEFPIFQKRALELANIIVEINNNQITCHKKEDK